jgi:hypothetical protein
VLVRYLHRPQEGGCRWMVGDAHVVGWLRILLEDQHLEVYDLPGCLQQLQRRSEVLMLELGHIRAYG